MYIKRKCNKWKIDHNEYSLVYTLQRLAGATLLVFANKQDLPGALAAEDIRKVSGKYLGQRGSVFHCTILKIDYTALCVKLAGVPW